MPQSLSRLATEHPKALFDALNRVQSVIAFNLNGEVLDANSNFLAMFGYTLSEVVGQHHRLFCHPDYVQSPEYAQLWQRLARGEVDSGEYKRVAKNGADVWIQSSYNPIFDASGNPQRVMKFATDITQRKQAELALRRAQLALEMSNEAARIGTWEYEPTLQRFQTSALVCQLFHLPDQPTLGLNALTDRLVDPEPLCHAIALAVSHASPWDLDLQVHTPAGGVNWVRAIGRCQVLEGGSKRLHGTFQDIDTGKARERELAQAREVAEAASHSKDLFLAAMSHELRTPMNAILGFGQMLECDHKLSADQQDSVQEILKAGKHLLSLINDVLDLAKISAGRVDISLSAVGLHGLLTACEALIQPMAQAHGIGLRLSVRPDVAVLADPVRLKQVLLNLLTNAVKYNRPGGFVHLDGKQGPEPGLLRLTVTDTGMGIQPADLPRIFKPFTRLEGADPQVEGTGIGLSITQQLVDAMGGVIGVASEPGVGSRFWVDFPLAQTAAQPTGNAQRLAAIPTARVKPMFQVLCIDDNLANLKLMRRVLQDPGLTLHTTQDATEGVDLAAHLRPDLILLDINLPGADGYAVLQRLRALPHLAQVPVLAVTADAMPHDIARGKAAGFAEYITKPLDIAAFVATVHRHMRDTQVGSPEQDA